MAGSHNSLLLVMSRILPRAKTGLGPGGNDGLSLDFCLNQMKPAVIRVTSTAQNAALRLGLGPAPRKIELGVELIEGMAGNQPPHKL